LTGKGTTALNDVSGLAEWFRSLPDSVYTQDNPVGTSGLHCYHHGKDNELYITYNSPEGSKTLVLSTRINKFVSFDTATPKMYAGNRDKLLSRDNANILFNLYAHKEGPQGLYYGVQVPSSFTILSNAHPLETKVWDNVELDAYAIDENDIQQPVLWKELEVWDAYQHSGIVPLVIGDNIKRVEREWQLNLPRNVMTEIGVVNIFDPNNWDTTRIFKDRIRDKHVYVKFTLNVNNTELRQYVNYAKLIFRLSRR